MRRFSKVYLEISDLCNLRCAFCPGTKRTPYAMTEEEFTELLPKLRPYTDFLYFHLMGEPLCHPLLGRFLELAGQMGFRVILTTNGTLLHDNQSILLSAPALHKVNISLHAFEANELPVPFSAYLDGCIGFGLAPREAIVCYRLWNAGGADRNNGEILSALHEAFPEPWVEGRQGIRIAPRTYLQFGERFDWPDMEAPEGDGRVFCYGLRDQLGVLCDGTVVPCCLDHEGELALGNLHRQELSEILTSPRAEAIYRGFSERNAPEALCRRCGFVKRFG